MSSLIVSHDLHIMMLEFSVEKLFVPTASIFDKAILRKSIVMFRMLDNEWTSLLPHRRDHQPYHGSNYEEEPFYGGKSVVFAIPEASLEKPMEEVDIQVHVRREVSRYFEMDPCQNIGIACINVQDLFNGIIKDLDIRRKLLDCGARIHEREPISRSAKDRYPLIDEDGQDSGAAIEIYVRITYFGKSIITETDIPESVSKMFYVREETNQKRPYQCRELDLEEVERGCWGSRTFVNPADPRNLKCICGEGGKVRAKKEGDGGDGGAKVGQGGEGGEDGGDNRGSEGDRKDLELIGGEPGAGKTGDETSTMLKDGEESEKLKDEDAAKVGGEKEDGVTSDSEGGGGGGAGGDDGKKSGGEKERKIGSARRRRGGCTVGITEKKKPPCPAVKCPEVDCIPLPCCYPCPPPFCLPYCQPFPQCVFLSPY